MTQNTLWQPSDISSEAGAEGGEQDSPKRRGRIPQSAWPQILERYRAGATLSAIAREFECTPSAISYIVRKAEASGAPAGDPAAGTDAGAEAAGEKPAMEKPAAAETSAEAAPAVQPAPTPPAPTPPAPTPSAEAPQPARAPRRAAEAPRPAAEAAPAAKPAAPAPAAPAPAPAAEAPRPAAEAAPRPADAPKTRLELKPTPAPTPAPAPAPAAAPVAAPATGEAPAAAAPRPAGARAEPTPPVDETEARLRETARGCLAAYRTWRQQPGQGSVQALSDAVHDLRKVLARIEIDMSVSRRDEQVARPIPIPAHRAARRPQ